MANSVVAGSLMLHRYGRVLPARNARSVLLNSRWYIGRPMLIRNLVRCAMMRFFLLFARLACRDPIAQPALICSLENVFRRARDYSRAPRHRDNIITLRKFASRGSRSPYYSSSRMISSTFSRFEARRNRFHLKISRFSEFTEFSASRKWECSR